MHGMQFIFGDHFNPVLAFGDGKRRNHGHVKKTQLYLTLSLPECLMEFCKVTLTFESVVEIL